MKTLQLASGNDLFHLYFSCFRQGGGGTRSDRVSIGASCETRPMRAILDSPIMQVLVCDPATKILCPNPCASKPMLDIDSHKLLVHHKLDSDNSRARSFPSKHVPTIAGQTPAQPSRSLSSSTGCVLSDWASPMCVRRLSSILLTCSWREMFEGKLDRMAIS